MPIARARSSLSRSAIRACPNGETTVRRASATPSEPTEPGGAERDNPADPQREVEPGREQGEDQDPGEQVQVVRGVEAPHPEGGQAQGPPDRHRRPAGHRRSAAPKRPLGRSTSTTAMTRKTSGVWNAGSRATPNDWTGPRRSEPTTAPVKLPSPPT